MGFAVGPEGETLYHTHTKQDRIVRIRLGTNQVTPIVKELHNPTDIAIDEKNGTLYWTDLAATVYTSTVAPGVYRANLDGSEKELVLADSTLSNPK